MAHNPYTPPGAAVDDVVVPAPLRPWQMKLAIGFMIVSLAVSIISFLIEPEAKNLGAGLAPSIYAVLVAIAIALFGLVAVLILLVGRGYRWARIAYAVLALLGLISEIRDLPVTLGEPWPRMALYLLSMAVDAATIVLLFLPASNAWFRARRAARQAIR